ncbi:hypothetical protein M1452_01000 [Candidatus Marsarchaeota archaeon]|jgi:Holliday junction resolvase|nr:hypothetical protein [Candidatus Marsarchaeota archaeon]
MYDEKKRQKNIERAKAAKGLEITLDVEDKVINTIMDYNRAAGDQPAVNISVEEPDVIVLELRPPMQVPPPPRGFRDGLQHDKTKKLRKRTVRILTDEKAVDAINAFASKFDGVLMVSVRITHNMELTIKLTPIAQAFREFANVAAELDPPHLRK